ncbi:MAG: YggT family protein [Succinivibrio sp.]
MFQFLIMFATAVVVLFELRALMQSSHIDYYNPFAQAVVKLTEPVIRLLPYRNSNIKGFYYCGFTVAFAFAFLFFLLLKLYLGMLAIDVLILSIVMTVKGFGYMLFFLLIAQALTSWLPSTRQLSFTLSQITYPIVSPIQRIIPPIGMIDISLMILMLALFALDSFFAKIFKIYWFIC